MRGNHNESVRSGGLLLTPILLSIVALPGCVRTQDVAAPGPGHPAFAESASVAFVPPDNLFAHAIEPASDHNAVQPVMDMPGMSGKEHGDSGDSGLTVYSCPMHADVRSDRPGTCPKCGMQLAPSKVTDEPHKHGGPP